MIKNIFIFICFCANLPLLIRSDNIDYIRQRFNENKYCIRGDLYKAVKKDDDAMKYYVRKLCSQFSVQQAKARIHDKYGTKKESLGEGSFGKVYRYKKNDTNYAIKIPKNFSYKDLFKELNASECLKYTLEGDNAMNSMAYILECLNPKSNSPHLIMKYYPKTLESYINGANPNGWSNLSSDKKQFITKQMLHIAKTLAAMHEQHLVHRDLKPENIMVNSKNVPILVDFGLTSPNGKYAKTIGGTPYFLDYQMVNETAFGPTNDVYSMLATYAYMVHGKRALAVLDGVLRGGNYKAAMKRFSQTMFLPRFADFKMPSEFSWMSKMFIEESKGRWTMQQVADKLEEMIGGKKTMVATQAEINKQAAVVKQEPKDIVHKKQMIDESKFQKPLDQQQMLQKEPVIQMKVKNPYMGNKNEPSKFKKVQEERDQPAPLDYGVPKFIMEKPPVDDYNAKLNAKVLQIQAELNQNPILAVNKEMEVPDEPKIAKRYEPARYNNNIYRKKQIIAPGGRQAQGVDNIRKRRAEVQGKEYKPVMKKKISIPEIPQHVRNEMERKQPKIQTPNGGFLEQKNKYENPYLKGIGVVNFEQRKRIFDERQIQIDAEIQQLQNEIREKQTNRHNLKQNHQIMI